MIQHLMIRNHVKPKGWPKSGLAFCPYFTGFLTVTFQKHNISPTFPRCRNGKKQDLARNSVFTLKAAKAVRAGPAKSDQGPLSTNRRRLYV